MRFLARQDEKGRFGVPAWVGQTPAPPAPPAPFVYGPGLGVRDRRLLSVVGAAGALGLSVLVKSVPSVGPLCPMRRLLGIPCPACGSTTTVVALLTLRPLDAIAANPLMVVGIFVVLSAWLPLRARTRLTATWNPVRARWRNFPTAVRWPATTALVGASWWWQLHRFDLA
jgi:hypothetical protein